VTGGARPADSPADACRESQAVITMLADDHAVAQVVFGENGVPPCWHGTRDCERALRPFLHIYVQKNEKIC